MPVHTAVSSVAIPSVTHVDFGATEPDLPVADELAD